MTGGGFATPHAPKSPAVLAARTTGQQAEIAMLRAQLTNWKVIWAD
ncbi:MULTISPECIES: hypothetical protein [unclassified Cryobacterium]|nr:MULTISPECIES: hypothetical protein [unclassified Cryobacterium]MDY7543038.1 hypothetical protein [Cryobacterium sp. 5B3]MEB0000965.1 hypothetical protein [Cryobacterium sp. RTS3]MEB0267844.1 hypothetical protein [Cryobacterium sp. 10I5]MEB0276707.1 hypothetical protein [Cryobacterium sp. 5B3]